MAKLLDLSVYGPGHISNILQVDASVYAKAFVTDGGKDTQVVRGDGTLASISSLYVGNAATATNAPWSGITGKPTTFTPSAHTHTASDITGLPTSLKNPYKLTFGSKTYDGSAAATITASDLGALTSITKPMIEGVLTGNITSHAHSQYLTSALRPAKLFTSESIFPPGYFIITINNNNSKWILSFDVKIVVPDGSYTIRFSEDNSTKSESWYRPSASMIDGEDSVKVKFGYSRTNKWVAILATDSYAGVSITNVANGYAPIDTYALDKLFTINFFDDWGVLEGDDSGLGYLGTVQETITIYPPSKEGHTHTFASLTSKPTTINGYGITDALTTSNYNSYVPTRTGTGASGTWGISISGNAATATKLSSDAGSATNPIYFSGGKPVACTYSLNKTVPSNAVFTDTNTWRPVTNTYTGSDQSTCVSQYGTNALYNALVNGYASSAGTSTYASRLGDSNSYYTKSSLDTALNGKANSSHGTHVSGTSFSSGNSGAAEHNCNSITSNGHWYYNSNGPSGLGENSTDGALYSQAYSDAWVGQIAQDYRNGNLFTRGKRSGTWTAWKAVSYNGHTHTKRQITDFPNSMPASDVYSWAKASTKPTYTYSEVGAAAASHTHSYLPLSGGTLTGMVTMKKSSASDDAIYWVETTNSNHRLGFGEGTSGNRGIYDKNLGWVFKIDTSNNVTISGNASTATSATKLQDNTAFTAWGQTFFENGKPKNVSGNLSLGFSQIYWNGDIEGSYISSNGMTSMIYNMRDGHIFRVGGDEILRIRKYGYKLQVNGSANATTLYENGTRVALSGHTHNYAGSSSAGGAATSVVVTDSNANSTYRMVWHSGNSLYSTDNIYCNPSTDSIYASAFYETSDEQLKDFENSVNVDLNLIRSIPKMYFRWKKNPNKLQIGTSAQAVKQIYPELVSSSEDGILSVDYSKLSIVALSAIDKLHLENQGLKHEINLLKQEIEKLKGQI